MTKEEVQEIPTEETQEKSVEETLSDEIGSALAEIVEEDTEKITLSKPKRINMIDENQLTIDNRQYQIVANYREAFDLEKLEARYSDVLNRYDYIVADWGYDQLRLKGFYHDTHTKAPVDQRIGTLQDYLYEFCNFGCAYFVLERVGGKKDKQQYKNKNKRKPKNKKTGQNTAHIEEKIESVNKKARAKKQPVIKKKKEAAEKTNEIQQKQSTKIVNNTVGKRNFTIRKKEN